ncbi:MAG: DUF6794 domain-containing protein [Accumulibacter sp.]|jgi:hypothetical protein|uniref:DUF6794 domain-containing protein n=1 Tax=Accumulibacter sp. TaxID=2053492 RepID=UPI002FC3AB0C
MGRKQWPSTIDEAVGVVIATLSDEDQAAIAAMAESELIGLHFGLGGWMRNNLGLWKGSRALLEATGEADAYDASKVIVEAAWRRCGRRCRRCIEEEWLRATDRHCLT